MKPYLVLPVTTVVSVALFAYMRSTETDRERQNRLLRFQDIKLRVTYDVLREYEKEVSDSQTPIDQANEMQKSLEQQVNELQSQNQRAKQEADNCQMNKKSSTDVLSSVELELNNAKASFDRQTSDWNQELEKLRQQLSAKSPVCEFLPTNLQSESIASKLCGIEVVNKEEPPKQVQQPNPEAPKENQPQPEAPKAEEKKEEPPKA